MKLAELPDLMHEQAMDAPAPIRVEHRLGEIRRRVVALRRRQWGAAVIAVLFIGTGVGLGFRPLPAPVAGKTEFPTYSHGSKLMTVAVGSLGEALSVTVVPSRLPLLFSVECPRADAEATLILNVATNGSSQGTISCNVTTGNAFGVIGNQGLQVGKPVTLTFTPEPARPAGQIRVGIYESVPVYAYPQPKPSVLYPLNINYFAGILVEAFGHNLAVLASTPGQPNQSRTYQFRYPACAISSSRCFVLGIESQTPGHFEFRINGTDVGYEDIYGYSNDDHPLEFTRAIKALGLHPGDPVTLQVSPSYATGAWEVGIGVKSSK